MQVMKTYHMYNADSISAQSKLKEAEKQEEKQIGKSVKQEDRQAPRSPDSTSNVRIEEKHVRRPQPVLLSPEITTTEAPEPLSPCSATREATTMRSVCTATRE